MGAKEIGAVLRKARKAAKLEIPDVSEILVQKGVRAGTKTVYSWELGRSQPGPDVLLMLCELYGIEDVLQTFGYKRNRPPVLSPETDSGLSLKLDLSPREAALIEAYRGADSDARTIVETALRRYLSSAEAPIESQSDPGFIMPVAARGGGRSTKQVSDKQIEAAISELSRLLPEEGDL